MHNTELIFLKSIESIRCDFLNIFFGLITLLGEETVLVVIICTVYFAYSKDIAKKITFITLTSLGFNSTIKNIAKVPRPFSNGAVTCLRPDTATGYSFPSGHTQNFAAWSSAFAFILKSKLLLILSVIITALVAFSRIYLGAHYPSDVIAGGMIGILTAYICNKLYDKFERKTLLYAILILLYAPFAVYFISFADIHFEDFFKIYGMIAGFLCSEIFETRFVKYECNGNILKKTLRVTTAVMSAFVIKSYWGELFSFSDIRLMFVSDAIKYFLLIFTVFALCPYVFVKTGL